MYTVCQKENCLSKCIKMEKENKPHKTGSTQKGKSRRNATENACLQAGSKLWWYRRQCGKKMSEPGKGRKKAHMGRVLGWQMGVEGWEGREEEGGSCLKRREEGMQGRHGRKVRINEERHATEPQKGVCVGRIKVTKAHMV